MATHAYIDTITGVDIGLGQIEAGWTDVPDLDDEFARYDDYVAAADAASASVMGAWEACDGDFHAPPM